MAITQRNNGDHCFYFYFRPFPPLTRKNYGHVLFRLFAYYVTYLVQRLSTKWRKIAGVSGNDKNRTRDDDGIAWDTRSNAVKIKKKKKTIERCLKSSWNHRTDPDWIFHTKCSYLSRLTFYLSIRPLLNIFDPVRVALTEVERTFWWKIGSETSYEIL